MIPLWGKGRGSTHAAKSEQLSDSAQGFASTQELQLEEVSACEPWLPRKQDVSSWSCLALKHSDP